ncbi:hypothetical protein GGI12_005821 [Dipsacomyces acuminosporus]|nr:hypothetical protein GGI12_005821 [Dipsacomyces acuminosporus]
MPDSFIFISDKTENTRILFVSRAVQDILYMDPEDMLGCNIKDMIYDERCPDFPYNPSTRSLTFDVVMVFANLNDCDNNPVLARIISIDCGDCIFSIARTVATRPDSSHYKYSCQNINDLRTPEEGRLTRRRRNIYTSQAPPAKACIMLESIEDMWEAHGLRITFVTNTICTLIDIAGGDEIIGKPFLSIVATRDILKVAAFLDRLIENDEPELITFSILQSPMDPRNKSTIKVVALGAGSSDGSLLLCRASDSPPVSPSNPTMQTELGSDCGYLGLEEIISSDPDTSDCCDAWKEF